LFICGQGQKPNNIFNGEGKEKKKIDGILLFDFVGSNVNPIWIRSTTQRGCQNPPYDEHQRGRRVGNQVVPFGAG
jgi:hypothetical protein